MANKNQLPLKLSLSRIFPPHFCVFIRNGYRFRMVIVIWLLPLCFYAQFFSVRTIRLVIVQFLTISMRLYHLITCHTWPQRCMQKIKHIKMALRFARQIESNFLQSARKTTATSKSENMVVQAETSSEKLSGANRSKTAIKIRRAQHRKKQHTERGKHLRMVEARHLKI